MKIEFLAEPELEFGTGRHVDIRFGLMNYGPLDIASPIAPRKIKLGLVGTSETVEGVQEWLERSKTGIAAKTSKQPNLFPRFPGYGPTTNLQAAFVTDSRLQSVMPPREIDLILANKNSAQGIERATDVFFDGLQHVSDKAPVDVLVCAVPMKLYEYILNYSQQDAEADEEDGEKRVKLDFHHLLKAKAMRLNKPIQIILPMTYDETKKRRQKKRPQQVRQLQDEATRAWNFYVALYYKAGGTPWRLFRDQSLHTVCYVGVGFYKTLDNSRLMTSTAQVFNERGDGIILRGGMAKLSKTDRQVHLESDNAKQLLENALKAYRSEHGNLPARVVLHKSSSYSQEELNGFKDALDAHGVNTYDLISIRDSFTRLFRTGKYPALRGTFLTKDKLSHVLYTRGSVDFFCTYPGTYVPKALELRCDDTAQTPRFLAHETLALTKMNWNNTQFDNSEPIVLKAARRVGAILKYVDETSSIQSRYSFYM